MTTLKNKPFLYTIKGVDNCPIIGAVPPKFFKECLTYKPDPSDVFVASYPKCGTTWTAYITYMLLNDMKIPHNVMDVMKTIFLDLFLGKEGAENMSKPRFIKTHLPFELVPYNNQTKYVCVTRNPFDCVVSAYHHTHGIEAFEFDGSFDEFFECFIRGEVEFGNYFQHVMSWYAHKDDPNVLFLTYEQLKENTGNCIVRIGQFIGGKSAELVKDPNNIDKIIEASSMKSMKKIQEKTEQYPSKPSKNFQFFRKGITSGFREYLSKEQYDRLDELYQSTMKGTFLIDHWRKYVNFEEK